MRTVTTWAVQRFRLDRSPATGVSCARGGGVMHFSNCIAVAVVATILTGCKSSESPAEADGGAVDAADGPDAPINVPGNGGSTATCSPSPCSDPGYRGFQLMVPDSNGSDAINVA